MAFQKGLVSESMILSLMNIHQFHIPILHPIGTRELYCSKVTSKDQRPKKAMHDEVVKNLDITI